MTKSLGLKALEALNYDNSFVRELPGDPEAENFRRRVDRACYSRVKPTPVAAPKLVAHAQDVADLLGLSKEACLSQDFAEVFAGNLLVDGMEPFAACYGGHQFGNWAGQLGDGRAISLAEVLDPQGQRWELQLKGAGPTPYSRSADGRAVLRSSVREFLCSEAMHALGVPTTRALSLVDTGEKVVRDMLYSGNPQPEPGAVVCRVSPSFIRFGNFQIFASRDQLDTLKTLVDYTIHRDFPHLGAPSDDTYLQWLTEVCQRTAVMVVHWLRVGFVHGVMNTDNMSILGLTIDYGPYGWLDNYDPNWTPNTTDAHGRRYRYGQQPNIALWNLLQLAEALHTIIDDADGLADALREFPKTLGVELEAMVSDKLGLAQHDKDTDGPLYEALTEVLVQAETDMTIFFRNLAQIEARSPEELAKIGDEELMSPLREAYYKPEEELSPEVVSHVAEWLRIYSARLAREDRPHEQRKAQMDAANPKYVLRNYMAQLAIDKAEEGDPSLVQELHELLKRPYDEQPEHQKWFAKRPDWARNKPGCSMLSCSS